MVLPLTQLTERERAKAMERFDVLRPILEGREQLAAIADQHQLSLRTLQRWIRRYHTDGLAVSADNGVPTEAIIVVSLLSSTSSLKVSPSSTLRSPWPLSIDGSVS